MCFFCESGLNFHVHQLPSILVCKKLSTYEYIIIQREKKREEKREENVQKEAVKLLDKLKGQTVRYSYFLIDITKLSVCSDLPVIF